MNLDYYKSKLEDLIRQAEKDGYELSNNNFSKTDNDKFPVMEVFFVNNTAYEDYGYFNIYKRTLKIPQEDYNEILDYAKKNNCKNIKIDCCNGDDVIERIFYGNDESNINFSMGSTGGNIFVRYNHYHVYTDEDECVDLFFSKKNDDDDFPRGYVSFYMMERHDFEKAENVNLNLKKFMKNN